MTVGIVMLVHDAFDRAEQVARHWATSGCPVVIHVDLQVENTPYRDFVASLSDLPNLRFSKRHRCEWGMWSLVKASQTAAALMLESFPDVRHVFLASGSCLPLRPVQELIDYLGERPQTDFIESATIEDVPWAIGGLDRERFTLRFPFSWRRQRLLFDRYVKLQRRVKFKRRIPAGLVPHLGSQWWCLTRRTLSAILEDPDREVFEKYFKRVWIPDESYYQTLARYYSTSIESRSLTLSKFDYQGKPHMFYDDHLQLLRRSDCFVARKIWPRANRLYDAFLTDAAGAMKKAEPNPNKIDRIFAQAVERRKRGRPGLYMQSRYPNEGWENGATHAPYTIFQGYSDLFADFIPWMTRTTGVKMHGHLFGPDDVEFVDGEANYSGGLSASGKLRDANPKSFLTNLIWNTRGERQCFQFGPADNQKLNWFIAKDSNASIFLISGAWVVPLFKSNQNFSTIRREAARLQQRESDQIDILRSSYARAEVHILSLADFVSAPVNPLKAIVDKVGHNNGSRINEAPKMVDMRGLGQFLQNLKNQGMHPHLMGDFPMDDIVVMPKPKPRKPYLVKK
jgi:hypothetical protein